jgi:hypothetical protein
MLLPSGVGNVLTLNVCSDVWDCVGSYTIRMLLVCSLKIISSPNLKLIISFLVLPLVLLCHTSRYHLLPQCGTLLLTLHVYLRLAIRPSAQLHTSCYHLLPQRGTLLLTLHVYLRLAIRPSAQFANLL